MHLIAFVANTHNIISFISRNFHSISAFWFVLVRSWFRICTGIVLGNTFVGFVRVNCKMDGKCLSFVWQTSKIKWADRTLWEQAFGVCRFNSLTKRVCEANMVSFYRLKCYLVLWMIPCLGLGCLFERKVWWKQLEFQHVSELPCASFERQLCVHSSIAWTLRRKVWCAPNVWCVHHNNQHLTFRHNDQWTYANLFKDSCGLCWFSISLAWLVKLEFGNWTDSNSIDDGMSLRFLRGWWNF